MDIARFHAAFFEESREGLDAMESGLLSLESGGAGADPETINVIFRAAHSIKGGAATFGFTSVTDLTHLLETLLDEARAGRRTLDQAATGALLASVDVLRGLLAACEHGSPIDANALAAARAGLDALLSGKPPAQARRRRRRWRRWKRGPAPRRWRCRACTRPRPRRRPRRWPRAARWRGGSGSRPGRPRRDPARRTRAGARPRIRRRDRRGWRARAGCAADRCR